MALIAAFGALALVLAGVGVYGVLSLVVAERTREIGIRLALGASPRGLLALVVNHALVLSIAGVARRRSRCAGAVAARGESTVRRRRVRSGNDCGDRGAACW